MQVSKRLIISALATAAASVVSVSAATVTSADFSFAFGATIKATSVGSNAWTDINNTNSLPTIGDFSFLPAPAGQAQSGTGPKFFQRVLYDGDGEDQDKVGALSDPFGAGGFSLPVTASYNGPAPVDAAATPNYRLQIELTRVSIYAATSSSSSVATLAWDEVTPGHLQTSSSISLNPASNTPALLNAASTYKPLVWDPADYDSALGSLNSSFTRTFDFLPGTGNDEKIGDGIQVEGRVHLIYDVVPEPASFAGICVAAGAFMGRRRR